MNRVEFKLSMPNRGSWNGGWSGEGRDYLIFKNLSNKKIVSLGLDKKDTCSWYHSWNDGWGASVIARVLQNGEKKKKSAGFCGYDWMVDNILCYNKTERSK